MRWRGHECTALLVTISEGTAVSEGTVVFDMHRVSGSASDSKSSGCKVVSGSRSSNSFACKGCGDPRYNVYKMLGFGRGQ